MRRAGVVAPYGGGGGQHIKGKAGAGKGIISRMGAYTVVFAVQETALYFAFLII